MFDYKLTQINIYPVKSLGGTGLKTAEVTDRGLKYDRRWMLVDQNGRFLTQRVHPAMALIGIDLKPPVIEMKHKLTGETISFDIEGNSGKEFDISVWDDIVHARAVDKKTDEWLCDILKIGCSLVHMPEESRRSVDKKYASNNEIVSFADAFPFLIIGEESLNDLNSRLEEKLPMNRFRPNFVFSGGKPFDEDRWKSFKISGMEFYPVKPCIRCTIPTVNQETGERGEEPLRTLASYRAVNNKIYFGQNLLHSGSGTINTGDELEVTGMK
jgi:uncharacterized protein